MSKASLNNGCCMAKQGSRIKPCRVNRGSSKFTAWNQICTYTMRQGSNTRPGRRKMGEAWKHHRQPPGDATRWQRRRMSPVVSERQVKLGCARMSHLMPHRSPVEHDDVKSCPKHRTECCRNVAPPGQELCQPMRIIGETSVCVKKLKIV